MVTSIAVLLAYFNGSASLSCAIVRVVIASIAVLLLAYFNGNASLCRAIVKVGAMLGVVNRDGLSIFNAPVATKQLLFKLLGIVPLSVKCRMKLSICAMVKLVIMLLLVSVFLHNYYTVSRAKMRLVIAGYVHDVLVNDHNFCSQSCSSTNRFGLNLWRGGVCPRNSGFDFGGSFKSQSG